ncbi:hypothetical protein LP419_34120 [Massilia sp. H-1]|nr:hypothetical protein LP419_34120 [Massilia sp. H-1]
MRDWLRTRIEQKRPPPDAQQIRRELGWDLVKVLKPCRAGKPWPAAATP